jgi:hypothetical protein
MQSLRWWTQGIHLSYLASGKSFDLFFVRLYMSRRCVTQHRHVRRVIHSKVKQSNPRRACRHNTEMITFVVDDKVGIKGETLVVLVWMRMASVHSIQHATRSSTM